MMTQFEANAVSESGVSRERRRCWYFPLLCLSLAWLLPPGFLSAADLPATSQLFTLSALPGETVGAADLSRRVFAGAAHYAIESALPNTTFGEQVALGDFNGDKRLELAVASSRFKMKGRSVGKVCVFSFPTPGAVPRLESQWIGGELSQRSGAALAAGDANGDGTADLLVGVASVSDSQRHVGMVNLFEGSRAGLNWTSTWDNLGTDSSGPHQVILAADMNRDGCADVFVASTAVDKAKGRGGGVWLFMGTPTGIARRTAWSQRPRAEGTQFGEAMLAADLNGDGWPDLLAGAPQNGNGSVSVFMGGAGGLPGQPQTVLRGSAAESEFGKALAVVGDLNGDGCMDVVVGAPGSEGNRQFPGAVFLHLGSRTGLVEVARWSARGWRAASAFGNSIAGVGDVNGDGKPDLLVGAPGRIRGNVLPGRASLWLGRGSGFAASPEWEVTANVNDTRLGDVVAGCGDLDGDGLNDFVITSHEQTAKGTSARVGRVDVFRGLRQGYAAAEKFPADGSVCVTGDHTPEARATAAHDTVVAATNSAALSARALAETRSKSRIRTVLISCVSLVAILAAGWLLLNRRQVRVEAVRSERERIARDLHDGLGSGVHRLQRLTELLNRAAVDSLEADCLREDLLRTSQELSGTLDRTIWAVKPENDTLDNLVNYLAGYAPAMLEPHGIECELDLPAALPRIPLRGNFRQHLFLAVNEALNNVGKHSQAKHAWLRVKWEEPWLQVVVEDDGCGLTVSPNRTGGGNGLKNLRERLGALGGDCVVRNREPSGVKVEMRASFGKVGGRGD